MEKGNEMTIQGNEQRISSLDIAAVTGKPHNDVLKAIRKMEPAWERECGGKFFPHIGKGENAAGRREADTSLSAD